MKLCLEIPDLRIKIEQHDDGRYCVTNGKSVHDGLRYGAAAVDVGFAIFYAMKCEGLVLDIDDEIKIDD